MADETYYNLAQFLFNGKEVLVGGFKTTRKLDSETYSATNSHYPYRVSFGQESLSWEISDVDPSERKFFKDIVTAQKQDPNNLPEVATYDFNEITGDLVEDDVFYGCWVNEISKEDANKPFSVKGEALKIKN